MLQSDFMVNFVLESGHFDQIPNSAECMFSYDCNFPYDCQKNLVPYSLKLLISMILYGPCVDCIDTQSCLTISQLILFNYKKKQLRAETMTSTRHSLDREPPLPIYIGLNIHSLVRSKKLMEQLSNLGISITYDRALQLEENRALSMCRQYQLNNVVCPSHLQKGHFIACAMDNVDHNPSSTTTDSSFHGTLLSILLKILAQLLNKVSHLLQTLLMSLFFLLPMP